MTDEIEYKEVIPVLDTPTDLEPRYGAIHRMNGVEFQLEEFEPDSDDNKILIEKLVEQSIRDYMILKDSIIPVEKRAWETAVDFLYDDEYLLHWGTWEISPRELLDIIDIDLDWLRGQITKQAKRKVEVKET